MARQARLVVPGHPHHVIQRGVRRMKVFLREADYRTYLELLAAGCARAGTRVWAYCLMPNHVHLILVPRDEDGLRAALGETHRRYAQHINRRQRWHGHLWEGRFASFVMDEPHLIAAARYVELNPVRAALVRRARDWPWSSARAHLEGRDDGVVQVAPLLERAGDWRAVLRGGLDDKTLEALRGHIRTGRPAGSAAFLKHLGKRLGRPVTARPRGRPPKASPKG